MTTPVLMRRQDDCQISSVGTATGKTYEEVIAAEGLPELPFGLNDPIRGNPLSLYRLLIKLGFWKRNITWSMLEKGRATPGKTIILIHDPSSPLLAQHYIVLAGYTPIGIQAYWGYSIKEGHDPKTAVNVTMEKLKLLMLGDGDGAHLNPLNNSWPNCAFEVIKDTAWNRFLRWLGVEK